MGQGVARNVIAVLSLSFPCVTGRKPIAILVDQAPDEGTLFVACIAALGANLVLLKLLLGSLPLCSIYDRLMLTRMAEVLVICFWEATSFSLFFGSKAQVEEFSDGAR